MKLNEKVKSKLSSKLISVDGPDGVGKGTFSKILLQFLKKKLNESILLTSGTRFEACKESKTLESEIKEINNSVERNRFFLLSSQKIYKHKIIPAIDSDKIVILDSSLLRHLAYTHSFYGGNSKVFLDTYSHVRSGQLNFGISPSVRILLDAPAKDLLKNLNSRGKRDKGDPSIIKEVNQRKKSYYKTTKIIKEIVPKDTTWIKINNPSLPKDKIPQVIISKIKKKIFPVITKKLTI